MTEEEKKKTNSDPFASTLDERSAPILMSKAKLMIQEDFNIMDIFTTDIKTDSAGAGKLLGFTAIVYVF